MNGKKLSLVAGVAGALLLGPALDTASAQTIRYGDRRTPLEGRRYETMRALAHYLDQNAQAALEAVMDEARRERERQDRYPRLRRLTPSVRDFARRADHFHQMMDDYEAERPDITARVNDLANRARTVNQRIRAVPATLSREAGWADEWDNVLDVLKLMNRVIAGYDVEVPVAHEGFEDYDRDYGPFRDARGGVARTGDTGGSVFGLSGSRLQQFRQLAHDLDESALQAHQVAEVNMINNSDRHRQFLADLRRFAERARDVHTRADANVVNPRDIGPIVDQLLRDARETDRSMRNTRVFPEVWDQWTRTVDILDRMAVLVRY